MFSDTSSDDTSSGDTSSGDTSSAMLWSKNNDILIRLERSDQKKTKKQTNQTYQGYLKYEFASTIVIDVLLKNKIFKML